MNAVKGGGLIHLDDRLQASHVHQQPVVVHRQRVGGEPAGQPQQLGQRGEDERVLAGRDPE